MSDSFNVSSLVEVLFSLIFSRGGDACHNKRPNLVPGLSPNATAGSTSSSFGGSIETTPCKTFMESITNASPEDKHS